MQANCIWLLGHHGSLCDWPTSEARLNHVEITLFTPSEEARTGADWYWRIERAGLGLHALVQAKRVQRTGFGQPDHAGDIDLDLPQLTLLRDRAKDMQSEIPGLMAWLATYARYDATPPCERADLSQCNRHRHVGSCRPEGPSLWIANATVIAGMPTLVPVKTIVEESVRLDCVLPCVGQDGNDSPNGNNGPGSKGLRLERMPSSFQECTRAILNDKRVGPTVHGHHRSRGPGDGAEGGPRGLCCPHRSVSSHRQGQARQVD